MCQEHNDQWRCINDTDGEINQGECRKYQEVQEVIGIFIPSVMEAFKGF